MLHKTFQTHNKPGIPGAGQRLVNGSINQWTIVSRSKISSPSLHNPPASLPFPAGSWHAPNYDSLMTSFSSDRPTPRNLSQYYV